MKTVVAIILSFSIVLNYINSDDWGTKQNELEAIMDVAAKNEMMIQSWTVYSRESVGHVDTMAEVEASFKKMMEKHFTFTWEEEEGKVDHHYVITGTKGNMERGITEKMVVTAYHISGVFDLTVTHEVSGDKWKDENLQFIDKYNFKNTDKQEVFYTVRGNIGKGVSDLRQQAKRLVKDFEASEVEGLYESNFVSMSLITDKFTKTVKTSKNKEMNLQMGLRTTEKNDTVDVTIGTPIITTEY